METIKFYISDLHFGHKNCITFDQRPFFNLKDMEETLIANWNNTVTENDEVYILGDFCWGKNDEWIRILKQLKGKKYLIRGNHDDINKEVKKYFVWVKNYAEIKDNDRNIVLSHYPITFWNKQGYGSIHLYGHIHQGRDERPFELFKERMKSNGIKYNCYNVGCMLPYMDYTPRTLDDIMKGI